MRFPAYSSPHSIPANRVTTLMAWVLAALLPGIVASWWFFGWGSLIQIVLATTTAVAAEALIIRLRHRPALPAINDLSATVTALLFALSVPPLLPWWLTVTGILFGIIIVKQLYGGLGYNPFNPAMAAYVFLLISFPAEMTQWSAPAPLAEVRLDLSQTMQLIFTGVLPESTSWDALTMATPLDEMRNRLDQGETLSTIRQLAIWSPLGGIGKEWISIAFLAGGIFLLWRNIISWQIPVSMLMTTLMMASVFWLIDPDIYPQPLFHLFSGGLMLGAFFIATDPVTAATTKRGQLIFGALIGVLVYIIRTWGGYPDAVAFAVLLMNMAAPTIDYYTQPRVYGQQRGDKHD